VSGGAGLLGHYAIAAAKQRGIQIHRRREERPIVQLVVKWYQGGDPSGPRHATIVVSARYVPNTLLASADEVIE
jgi:hypothetical protein